MNQTGSQSSQTVRWRGVPSNLRPTAIPGDDLSGAPCTTSMKGIFVVFESNLGHLA